MGDVSHWGKMLFMVQKFNCLVFFFCEVSAVCLHFDKMSAICLHLAQNCNSGRKIEFCLSVCIKKIFF